MGMISRVFDKKKIAKTVLGIGGVMVVIVILLYAVIALVLWLTMIRETNDNLPVVTK